MDAQVENEDEFLAIIQSIRDTISQRYAADCNKLVALNNELATSKSIIAVSINLPKVSSEIVGMQNQLEVMRKQLDSEQLTVLTAERDQLLVKVHTLEDQPQYCDREIQTESVSVTEAGTEMLQGRQHCEREMQTELVSVRDSATEMHLEPLPSIESAVELRMDSVPVITAVMSLAIPQENLAAVAFSSSLNETRTASASPVSSNLNTSNEPVTLPEFMEEKRKFPEKHQRSPSPPENNSGDSSRRKRQHGGYSATALLPDYVEIQPTSSTDANNSVSSPQSGSGNRNSSGRALYSGHGDHRISRYSDHRRDSYRDRGDYSRDSCRRDRDRRDYNRRDSRDTRQHSGRYFDQPLCDSSSTDINRRSDNVTTPSQGPESFAVTAFPEAAAASGSLEPQITKDIFCNFEIGTHEGDKVPYFLTDGNCEISSLELIAESYANTPGWSIRELAEKIYELCPEVAISYKNFILVVDHPHLEFFGCCGDLNRAVRIRGEQFCMVLIDQGDCFDHEEECDDRKISTTTAKNKMHKCLMEYCQNVTAELLKCKETDTKMPAELLKHNCKDVYDFIRNASECEHWLVFAGSDEMVVRYYRNAKHIMEIPASKDGIKMAAVHSNLSTV